MANILLLDPDDTACRAMQGILVRGHHRFARVKSMSEAWEFIQKNVRIDIAFVEPGTREKNGMAFIDRMKTDSLLKLLPVVIYTGHSDRDSVKHGLNRQVQNYLLKPYIDDTIFSEITKGTVNPWYKQHFEEEKSFCQLMGLSTDDLHKGLDALRAELHSAQPTIQLAIDEQQIHPIGDFLTELASKAEAVGAWGIVDCLQTIKTQIEAEEWSQSKKTLDTLTFAERLIFHSLNPTIVPQDFLTLDEKSTEQDLKDHTRWFNAPAENRCPVLTVSRLEQELQALPGCPVIDSAAASFQMMATGHPSCINPLMDLVDKDPGLAAQMLIAANLAKHTGGNDARAIEDPRLAIGLLGELRLLAQARGLVTASPRQTSPTPVFSWQEYWMFQMGTARMARFACNALELTDLASTAYTAGLLHDIGKLLLLRLHPVGLEAILQYARKNNVRLGEAERLFLGCSTHDMAVHFAEKHSLPRRYTNVIRWIREPLLATEDQNLVAVVSLARRLCRHNRVGSSGNKPIDGVMPLAETPAWSVLRNVTFPSFDLRKFEQQVHNECRDLKRELHGKATTYASA